MMAASQNTGRITGRHVLFGMVAFFGLVTIVNVVMAYWAIHTFSGTETDNAYKVGVAYNQRISEASVQNDLGWQEALAFDAATGDFSVTLTDKDGHGVDGLTVSAKFGRPATELFDRSTLLIGAGEGKYSARLDRLGAGTWAAQIAASRGAEGSVVYRSRARIWKQP